MKARIVSLALAVLMIVAMTFPAFAAAPTADEQNIITAMKSNTMVNYGATFELERNVPIQKLDLSKYTTMDAMGKMIIGQLEDGNMNSLVRVLADPAFMKVFRTVAENGFLSMEYYAKGSNGKSLYMMGGGINNEEFVTELYYGQMKFQNNFEDFPQELFDKHLLEVEVAPNMYQIQYILPQDDPDYKTYPESVFSNSPAAGDSILPVFWGGDALALQVSIGGNNASAQCTTARNTYRWGQPMGNVTRGTAEDVTTKVYNFLTPYSPTGGVSQSGASLFWGGKWLTKGVTYHKKSDMLMAPTQAGQPLKSWSILDKYGTQYNINYSDAGTGQLTITSGKFVQSSTNWNYFSERQFVTFS